MFNTWFLLQEGTWDDPDVKRLVSESEYRYIAWIDSSVKIVGDIFPLLRNAFEKSYRHFYLLLDSRSRSAMDVLNECGPRERNQFLKTLAGGYNLMKYESYSSPKKMPRIGNLWKKLRDIPYVSDKFIIFMNYPTDDLWKAALRFPELPAGLILCLLELLHEVNDFGLIPEQFLRGMLTI